MKIILTAISIALAIYALLSADSAKKAIDKAGIINKYTEALVLGGFAYFVLVIVVALFFAAAYEH